MSKSLKYWREKWELSKNEGRNLQEENAWKLLDLLAEYAAFFKHLPIIGLPVAWGGSFGRFFSGRWNTHHGDEIQSSISNYFHMDGYYAHSEKFHSVEFVLALIKKQIGSKPIDQNGDLAKILQVAKEKTSVDYFQLDAEAIYNKYINRNDSYSF